MDKQAKIFVAGHRGLVGSAIVRKLQADGFTKLLLRTRAELDLNDSRAVSDFFHVEKPEYVFLTAAKVGGILANRDYPADFIYENLQIQNNIIKASHEHGVNKLLFLGSSCIYPKDCQQPIKEEYLLSGYLEPTNEAYAIAKIAGIKMCQSFNKQYGTNYISVMPTNLYGPNDNFDLSSSHVLPALLRKFHEAKLNAETTVAVWGTGKPKREFLHVDDLASACLFLMENYNESGIVNIGTGQDLSIRELAELIGKIVDFTGTIAFDESKPDGTLRKVLDVGKLDGLGWQAKISLREGLEATYDWYVNNKNAVN